MPKLKVCVARYDNIKHVWTKLSREGKVHHFNIYSEDLKLEHDTQTSVDNCILNGTNENGSKSHFQIVRQRLVIYDIVMVSNWYTRPLQRVFIFKKSNQFASPPCSIILSQFFKLLNGQYFAIAHRPIYCLHFSELQKRKGTGIVLHNGGIDCHCYQTWLFSLSTY